MSLGNLPNARVCICSEDSTPSALPWPHFLGKKLRMQTEETGNRASPQREEDSAHPAALRASPPTAALLPHPSDVGSWLSPPRNTLQALWSPNPGRCSLDERALVASPSPGHLKVHQLPCPMHKQWRDAVAHSCMNVASSALLYHEP